MSRYVACSRCGQSLVQGGLLEHPGQHPGQQYEGPGPGGAAPESKLGQAPIQAAVDALSGEVQALEKLVEHVGRSLTPLMANPEEPEGLNREHVPVPASSQLGQHLWLLANHLGGLRVTLNQIILSLEL